MHSDETKTKISEGMRKSWEKRRKQEALITGQKRERREPASKPRSSSVRQRPEGPLQPLARPKE